MIFIFVVIAAFLAATDPDTKFARANHGFVVFEAGVMSVSESKEKLPVKTMFGRKTLKRKVDILLATLLPMIEISSQGGQRCACAEPTMTHGKL